MAAGILTGILVSARILGRIPTSAKTVQVARTLTSEEIKTSNGMLFLGGAPLVACKY